MATKHKKPRKKENIVKKVITRGATLLFSGMLLNETFKMLKR